MMLILACRKFTSQVRRYAPRYPFMTVGEGAPDLRGKSVTLVLADNGVARESRLAIGEAPVIENASPHCGRWC